MAEEPPKRVREVTAQNLYRTRTAESGDLQAVELFKERVLRARAMPIEQKLGLGAVLFEETCARMRDGIRHQFPDADEERVQEILNQQLDRLRQVEEDGVYQRVAE